jgi:hypothetical protein
MSWERLAALAAAYRRKEAHKILMVMCAAQGDPTSWESQQTTMLKILKTDE